MVTHMVRGVFLGGKPRHCICINASRGLSATAQFLASIDYLFPASFNKFPGNFAARTKHPVGPMHFSVSLKMELKILQCAANGNLMSALL